MRIVHLNYVFERGLGIADTIERYRTLRRVAEAQAERGDAVFVLMRHESNGELERNGVQYIYRDDNTRQGMAQPWTYPKDLHHIAARLNPDVVHVHSLKFHAQVRMLRAETAGNVPIVVQHHAERPASPPVSFLQRCCLEAANGFVFNGKGNAEEWLNAGIITRWDDVYEVPEGSTDFVPLPYNDARLTSGITGDPAVLWVGRMHQAKDPRTVLEGFRLYTRVRKDARLYMVFRGGPLEEEIRSRVADSESLQGTVTLLGARAYDDLPKYYSAADVFVTAAPYEGSNYALIEAMSCGCVSACSRIGPHRYITANGKFAEYFEPGDAAACAVAIGAAAARARDGRRDNVERYFQEELSFKAIARKLSDVYTKVIRG